MPRSSRRRAPAASGAKPASGPGGGAEKPDAALRGRDAPLRDALPRDAVPQDAVPQDALGPEDAGGLQIGVTEHRMVRLILTTPGGVTDLDYPPEDAREIAAELLAAADAAEG